MILFSLHCWPVSLDLISTSFLWWHFCLSQLIFSLMLFLVSYWFRYVISCRAINDVYYSVSSGKFWSSAFVNLVKTSYSHMVGSNSRSHSSFTQSLFSVKDGMRFIHYFIIVLFLECGYTYDWRRYFLIEFFIYNLVFLKGSSPSACALNFLINHDFGDRKVTKFLSYLN